MDRDGYISISSHDDDYTDNLQMNNKRLRGVDGFLGCFTMSSQGVDMACASLGYRRSSLVGHSSRWLKVGDAVITQPLAYNEALQIYVGWERPLPVDTDLENILLCFWICVGPWLTVGANHLSNHSTRARFRTRKAPRILSN